MEKRKREDQPINRVQWIHRSELLPNDYNPNAVAPPELKLLKISILEDGWTQPIVANPDMTIVDGFHRWTVSGHKEIYELTDGLVPVVIITPRDEASQKMATIRHNRARGTHGVLHMATIVESMIKDGLSVEEIMERVGMENEEVVRLAIRKGIPTTDLVRNADWSKSWTPK
jgi:ParB-like chromosome segregation protein Spo0J